MEKLKLLGFNNLTKTLSFNIYDVCYAEASQKSAYIKYIDEAYNSSRLTQILKTVADIIGAKILNIAHQDYEPQGASVTMLIAEGSTPMEGMTNSESPGPSPEAVVAHLDKSHLTVHTYPESHPHNGISTFRVDIDVSTCGQVSPLKALNYLIQCFDSDIVTLDYRVRGFTRDTQGYKHYIDHSMTSIQNFIEARTRDRYQMIDANIYEENIFHTKMKLRDFKLSDYLFCVDQDQLEKEKKQQIQTQLENEIMEIFYGRNCTGIPAFQ